VEVYFHPLELGYTPTRLTERSWEEEEALQAPVLGTDEPAYSTAAFRASFHLCCLYISAQKPFST